MAGMGKRMRPHTLTTPKPLLKIAGKSLVQRIVEDLKKSTNLDFSEIHFVIGDFGKAVEEELIRIALEHGAKGYIHFQNEPKGTAHAIYCATGALEGEVIIAFADTLFDGDFSIGKEDEAIIWTMRVNNPENYGVVITNSSKEIIEFTEKPKDFLSDEAIIGIYFFRKAELLKRKIELLFSENLIIGGEYQLTDALELLLKDNVKIKSANIRKWLDCGNKAEFLSSAISVIKSTKTKIKAYVKGMKFIEPIYLGENVSISNSIIGPGVIIEDNSTIKDSKIERSIVFANSKIANSKISDSIIGNNCTIKNAKGNLNMGDFSTYEYS